ncbi:hypothetical protein Tco_1204164 [Tanacetum coccineum]
MTNEEDCSKLHQCDQNLLKDSGCGLGEANSETRQKESMKQAFQDMHMDWGKLIQTSCILQWFYTKYKTLQDPSWSISVKTRNSDRHLQRWKLEDFICVVFVPDGNDCKVNSVCPSIGGRLLAPYKYR